MTDFLAIAAVTAKLYSLLFNEIKNDISGVEVTTRPPDKARDGMDGKMQVNLYLYQMMPDAAWRNMDIPSKIRAGERSHPLLALKLYYLLTAYYGSAEDGIDNTTEAIRLLGSQRLMGKAMSILHDNCILKAEDISGILPADDKTKHPYDQVELVRITPLSLSLEEMSKLWTTFSTNHRTSAAYEVSVLLIESSKDSRFAPPVLMNGENDRGISTLTSQSPVLYSINPLEPQPSGRLGETLTVNGDFLGGAGITMRFSNRHLSGPIEIEPTSMKTKKQMMVDLPSAASATDVSSKWVSGLYSVCAVVRSKEAPAWTTNDVPFALAPSIRISPRNAGPGTVQLTVYSTPRVRMEQKALLIFGDRQIAPASLYNDPDDASLPSELTFSIKDVEIGEHLIRLRVDGVDSLPFIRKDNPKRIEFDPDQKLTVNP